MTADTWAPQFVEFPKIPRLKRNITITEKIDGTNACVVVVDGLCYAQSRKRVITPESDNFGFAAWVFANSKALAEILGPGRWYGEWWGLGVQRGYGLDHKRFSLFDTRRWGDVPAKAAAADVALDVVPLLDTYTMSDRVIEAALDRLRSEGSVAAPGFMQPEGIVVRHSQSGQMYKVLLENDHLPKSLVDAA